MIKYRRFRTYRYYQSIRRI